MTCPFRDGHLAPTSRRWWRLAVPLAIAASVLGGAGCGVDEPAQTAGPAATEPLEGAARGDLNVVLITIDTLRTDRISCYGPARAETHNIDSFAGEGVPFTNPATTVPFTLPAHSSILTGVYPPGHGVRENVGYTLDERVPTVAEVLSNAGWATSGFEAQHGKLLKRLGLTPILDLNMRLGEASGACLAVNVLRGALACHVGIYFRTITWNGHKVHVGGIGGVATREDCRRRGYASLALNAAVHTIRANDAVKFEILFCEPHNFAFYQARVWHPFAGEVYCEQPSGQIRFEAMAPFVNDIVRAPRQGKIDLCGLPW